MLQSFHVALFSYCNLFMLQSFHVAPISCCSFFKMLFLCYTLFMLHFPRVALFSCCTALREFFQLYKDLIKKTMFFEGLSWLKLNNLGLTLNVALKLSNGVAKGLKLKVRKFWRLIPTLVEITGKNLVGGFFGSSPSWIGLKLEFYCK